jgi:hypothetical protein
VTEDNETPEIAEPATAEPTPRGLVAATRLKASARRWEVYQLALAGISYRAIGERYGISHTQVGKDVRAAQGEIKASGLRNLDEHRSMMLDRIIRVMAPFFALSLKGDRQAAYVFDRLARTHGYYLTLGEGIKINVTHELIEIAKAAGLDPDDLVAEAERLIADQASRRR